MTQNKALIILSGGQDSTTCLFWALDKFDSIEAISFDYGQRHHIELKMAEDLCKRKNIPWKLVDLNFLSQLSDNALTNKDRSVQGNEGMNNLPSTFVPGRNALFFTVAVSYGVPKGIFNFVTGVCQTDYSGYPDCREIFVQAMEKSLGLAVDSKIQIHTPLMHLTKAETFQMADQLKALEDVIEFSHTCYLGERGHKHQWGYGCGECPACLLRKKGFEEFKKLS